ncbi:MAG: hypothetical protein QG583_773 [Patescibacteria group bacterium]|nr:hypothetical protein [Patescibacteria group bacterium]
MEHYIGVLKKYAVFEGRASRMEFWMFILFSLLVSIALSFVDKYLPKVDVWGEMGILGIAYSLITLIPSLAVSVRRLHDINRSGLWLLLLLVPIIGFIVIIVFHLLESTPGENAYGPNPNGISTPPNVNNTPSAPTPPPVNPTV